MKQSEQVLTPYQRLDVTQAAAYLGRSRSWLDAERAKGRGPRYIKMGARVFYRKESLDAYLEACERETEESRTLARAAG